MAALVVTALVLLAAGSVHAATVTVAAMNFQYQPASRTVSVGDTVHWTFKGDPHSVTSGPPGNPDGRFDSGITDPGGSFQFTFVSAGTYHYFCQVHPEQMFGTIVVKAAASPPTSPTDGPPDGPPDLATDGSTRPRRRPPTPTPTRPPARPRRQPDAAPSHQIGIAGRVGDGRLIPRGR